MTELSQLGSYDVRVNGARPQSGVQFSYTGPDWMGPLLPMQPIAPPEVAGRTWDYVPGYNLTTQPRAYEPVSFHALRMLAESFDPVRLIIERRKDQMCRMPWAIRVKHDDPTKKRPAITELPKAKRQRLADITNFFKYPDRELTFRVWLRALLEDLLVLDAPSLYCEHSIGGDLIGLRYIDGSTIKRVIDDWGRTPQPIVWTGQPFDWNGYTVTAENFRSLGFVLAPGEVVAHQMPMGMKTPKQVLLPPAYQQVLKGLPAVNYTTWDLIYRPLNLRPGKAYGLSPVEQVMMTVSIAMRRSVAQLEYFREGNQPDAVYGLPESWTPDQIQRFQDYWDGLYSGNLAMRRRMKFVAGEGKYTPTHEPPLKNEFDEWLVRIVCFAFSYPPQAFVALSNRSTAEQHEKTAEEEGLDPLKEWAGEMFNEIITRRFGDDDIEFAWTEEEEVDQEKQSTILRGYAEDGMLTINQVREKLGEQPDPNPAANQLMVKTATGYVPIDANLIDKQVEAAKAMAAAVPPTPTPVTTGGPKPAPDEDE
ncbi:phage portal protein [Bradyrhizobium erythrophlei]|uniref:Phage portal protein n=1 Tax=Bradyrhizobium erythrophlei TaxID=1437360 RepID=A0A1M5NQ55_9BRAD|nr:phage portal protein [Bradyrhizobium erythrophlei]SHG91083.1 Phage portal protein [Bradyrhizobium erythrophlei]